MSKNSGSGVSDPAVSGSDPAVSGSRQIGQIPERDFPRSPALQISLKAESHLLRRLARCAGVEVPVARARLCLASAVEFLGTLFLISISVLTFQSLFTGFLSVLAGFSPVHSPYHIYS